MQAIILAAGRGKRLKHLTADTPKPLIKINNKPILEYILSSLPSNIDEVLMVINYLGGKIRKTFGNNFRNINIKYIPLSYLLGTAYAVWQTRPLIREGRFLVVNGDDLYDKKDLEKCLANDLALGLSKETPMDSTYLAFDLDQNKTIIGHHRPIENEKKILMATGAYVLDQRIFEYEPVKIANGEYGLPQTILEMSKKHPVKGVLMKKWIAITYPEDIIKAEKMHTKRVLSFGY